MTKDEIIAVIRETEIELYLELVNFENDSSYDSEECNILRARWASIYRLCKKLRLA